MMDTHRKHAPKGACFLMCVLRQDRQRGKLERRRRVAAVYGVSVLGCSSSDRIANETSTRCEVELISYRSYMYWIKCIFMINYLYID